MSTHTADVAARVRPREEGGLAYAAQDILNIVRRNLIKNYRLPQIVIFTTIQPVMLLLLFTFVFGGSIKIPGVKYVDYVVPAVLLQSVCFGSTSTGISLAVDLQQGMIDRFRSLPIARSAVLAGRTIADSVRTLFQLTLMVIVAYAIGFRFHAGPVAAVAMVALALFFGFSFSWISATIGLMVKEEEAVQAATFVWIFPLVFASSAFVPLLSLPGWLQSFARANPITSASDALRALALGGPTFTPVWHTLAWLGAILAVFTTLAVRTYRKTV